MSTATCPYCGEAMKYINVERDGGGWFDCPACKARSPIGYSLEDTVKRAGMFTNTERTQMENALNAAKVNYQIQASATNAMKAKYETTKEILDDLIEKMVSELGRRKKR